jgi:putative Holliday junction resolvase
VGTAHHDFWVTMTRYLGIDYGRRRIGLAIGDDALRIASPLDTLPAANDPAKDAARVVDRAAHEGVEALVVGLPLNMDGSAGPQAAQTRRFIEALRARAQLPVYEQDERLTTHAAEEALQEAGLSQRARAARRDKLAAQLILQFYFDRL